MTQYYPGIWYYEPSTAAAGFFAAVFIILSALHAYQAIRTSTWRWIPFVLGSFLEAAGYIARAVGAAQGPAYTLVPYLVNTIVVLVAPALMSASMYAEFSQIVRLTEGQNYTIIGLDWITALFVLGDLICLFAQAAGMSTLVIIQLIPMLTLTGAALLSNQTDHSVTLGNHIIILGLAFQVVFLLFFIVTGVTFEGRMNVRPTTRVYNSKKLPWKRHTFNLYVCSGIIILRCVYRIAQYAQGTDYYGYLVHTEWCMYVFDASFIIAVLVSFAVVHPSEVEALGRGHGVFIKQGYKVRHVNPAEDELPTVQMRVLVDGEALPTELRRVSRAQAKQADFTETEMEVIVLPNV